MNGTAFFLPRHSGSIFQNEICNLDRTKSSFLATRLYEKVIFTNNWVTTYKVLSLHLRYVGSPIFHWIFKYIDIIILQIYSIVNLVELSQWIMKKKSWEIRQAHLHWSDAQLVLSFYTLQYNFVGTCKKQNTE